MPEPGIHVYVGGVPINMSKYPSLYGCIRGLKIDNKVFELQKAAAETTTVSRLCSEGCELSPCKNGGMCVEMWQNQQFKCDCSFSDYAGPTCNIESSGYFQGQSVLQYEYDPPKETAETRTEYLELVFQVDSIAKTNMVLTFIYSQRYITHDFLMVYLDPNHGMYLNLFQGQYIYGIGKEGRFADGEPHQLVYRHHKNEMILTVRPKNHPEFRKMTINLDEEGISRVTVPDNSLDELDTIMVGGMLDAQFHQIPETADYVKYLNFSGCISEVTFYPVRNLPFALRPFKVLHDNLTTDGVLKVIGPKIDGCHTRGDDLAMKAAFTPKTTSAARWNSQLTFPPWNPGPAKTVFIGKAPVVDTFTTSVTTLTAPTSWRFDEENVFKKQFQEKPEDLIAAIALSMVAFLLTITILITSIVIPKCCIEKKKKADIKEKQKMVMKLPQNDSKGPNFEIYQETNCIAKLDEFSVVYLGMGSHPVKQDDTSTFQPPSGDASFLYSSVPQSDDDAPTCTEQRFYNHKKNRPPSSISEVLEEIKRQTNSGDLELDVIEDPVTMEHTQPLSCHHADAEIDNDANDDADDDTDDDADNESASPFRTPQLRLLQMCNWDSGYEAESKPDEDENLMSNSGHDNGSYHGDDTCHAEGNYHGSTDFKEEITPQLLHNHAFCESTFPSLSESENSNYLLGNAS